MPESARSCSHNLHKAQKRRRRRAAPAQTVDGHHEETLLSLSLSDAELAAVRPLTAPDVPTL